MPPYKTLIFDLDGTLIDSSASILGAYRAALEALGCQALRPLTPDLIGPPLGPTMDLLTGGADPQLREALVEAFKAHYDQQGYRDTLVFDGIAELLGALRGDGVGLFIATNKRIVPTRRILAHLGWEAWFQGVYALDAVQPVARNKGELLLRLQQREGLAPGTALYVGDRDEDALAAATAGLPFARADWGFGGSKCQQPVASQVARLARSLRSGDCRA